ncbi:translation elongation factor-like protein [Candidatus Bathyarchaeota archaeon]|nr:MAG: translation elongation factor-like protein [Candidatus Bathyarchaeota archaeon]
MAELKWKLVGEVIHYYTKLKVAIIELSDNLKLGDRISIEGFTTDLMQTVDSMQIEHRNVEKAVKGDVIGVKVEGRCRKGDEVKKIIT